MDYKERIEKIESRASALGIQGELADEIAALRGELEKKASDDLDARAEELLKSLNVSDTSNREDQSDSEEDFFNGIIAK